jgi:hypothetical protein
MSICKNCGVELGEGIDKCPLCEPSEKSPDQVISPADLFSLSRKQNAKNLYEISMLLLVSGVIVTIAIDAVFGRGLSWSLLTTACIGYLIAMISGIYHLHAKRYLMVLVISASTLLLLWLIDRLTGNKGWFMSIAGPMALSAAILLSAVIFFNSLSKYRGLNLLATILIALAIFMIIIEYLTDRLITSAFHPQWSVVTAASLIIIALIFVFIHYRLKHGRSLGRLFHV